MPLGVSESHVAHELQHCLSLGEFQYTGRKIIVSSAAIGGERLTYKRQDIAKVRAVE